MRGLSSTLSAGARDATTSHSLAGGLPHVHGAGHDSHIDEPLLTS
jgi:hypothetical protein